MNHFLLFLSSFTQVALVTQATRYIAAKKGWQAGVCSLLLSLCWQYNVHHVVFGGYLDNVLYALGAMAGSLGVMYSSDVRLWLVLYFSRKKSDPINEDWSAVFKEQDVRKKLLLIDKLARKGDRLTYEYATDPTRNVDQSIFEKDWKERQERYYWAVTRVKEVESWVKRFGNRSYLITHDKVVLDLRQTPGFPELSFDLLVTCTYNQNHDIWSFQFSWPLVALPYTTVIYASSLMKGAALVLKEVESRVNAEAILSEAQPSQSTTDVQL